MVSSLRKIFFKQRGESSASNDPSMIFISFSKDKKRFIISISSKDLKVFMDFQRLSNGDAFMYIVQTIRNAVILIKITRTHSALSTSNKFSSIIATLEVHSIKEIFKDQIAMITIRSIINPYKKTFFQRKELTNSIYNFWFSYFSRFSHCIVAHYPGNVKSV